MFYLGERVVHVLDSGTVPYGMKGTVVGKDLNQLDVVFDQPFMGGSTLGDR